MTDQNFSNEYFIDSNFAIKPEPISMDSLLHTASVPIPTRKTMMDMSELRDFVLEDGNRSPSSSIFQDGSSSSHPIIYSGNALWGTKIAGPDFDIKMEDDDIFQVDKSDLIQGPTLAELNANDESLDLNDLDDLSFDELLLPEENSYYIQVPQQPSGSRISPSLQVTNPTPTVAAQNCASSFPPDGIGFYKDVFSSSVPSSPFNSFQVYQNNLSPTSHHSSNSSLQVHSATSSITPPPNVVSPLQHKHSTLHELLLKKETSYSASPLGQSVPGPSSVGGVIRNPRYAQSRLSSSAPTHLGLEQIWQRREPRPHLLSTSSMAEGGSTSSLSTGKFNNFFVITLSLLDNTVKPC